MVEDLFKPFGKVIEISIKRTISGSPFAFVEFDNPRDAQDAIRGCLFILMIFF
jgi:splicing factor, arginine/serine-rich 1